MSEPALVPGVSLTEAHLEGGPPDHSQGLVVNMGPQHPSTHGVLRVKLVLDGEQVVSAEPDVGYLHTGIEKTMEYQKYLQALTCTDRIDYMSPPNNNLAYSLTVEKLLGVEIPERATVTRVIMAELGRLASHLVWLGTHALDLGALSVFLYCFREREKILDINEAVSGVRMMTSYIRPGGLYGAPHPEFAEQVRVFVEEFPSRVDEYEELLTTNPIWLDRTRGVGVVDAPTAISYALSGACLRGSGVNWDIRRAYPYIGYETYAFDVPVGTHGDVYDRYLVRVREMRESTRIIKQALDRYSPEGPVMADDRKVVLPPRAELDESMEALIHHFKIVTEGFSVPAGEAYVPTESGKGELGYYIVSDGGPRPRRVKVRAPSFVNLASLPAMAKGGMVADVVACIASTDIVLGEVDR
ncbi:MAG: NADH dehydrogenase (quinone) subunit D [Candidatus Dormibacteria bacterium]